VGELVSGVYRWESPHPEWSPEDREEGLGWERSVASYLVDTPDGPVLIDPLVADDGWDTLDGALAGRPPHVLITIFWHARSTAEILERYPGATAWVHAPAEAHVRERGVDARTFAPGDRLPGGIEAIGGGRAYEVLFYLPEQRALVPGDVLLGGGAAGVRLCPPSWLGTVDPDELRAGLRERLLELDVDHVLLTHGEPVLDRGRDALERALHAPSAA
jgi:glyoxylase-like metal-dependent hydrolase (beta-lactamase superfamily II)